MTGGGSGAGCASDGVRASAFGGEGGTWTTDSPGGFSSGGRGRFGADTKSCLERRRAKATKRASDRIASVAARRTGLGSSLGFTVTSTQSQQE